MARCVDCVHYPWQPEADVTYLPPMRCHPNLTMRRWTESTKVAEQKCAYFEPREQPEQSKKRRGDKAGD